MKNQFTIWIGLLLICFACGKETTTTPTPTPQIVKEQGVFIANEGGFGFNNASLSFYNFEEQVANHELFKNANGRALGDVLQSMTLHQEKLYLIMNHSNVIEVIDPENFQLISTIGTFNSPRYLLPVSESKAYLSDLFEDVIYVLDLASETINREIPLKGWTEEMVQFEDKVFVSNRESKMVYVIDINTDALIDSIPTSYNSNSLQLDKNNKLWVYCSGDESNNQLGGLFVINPTNHEVEKNLSFSDYAVGAWPRMAMNETKDTLYYLKDGLYRLPIQANDLAEAPFIPQNDRIFYALGVQASTGDLFIGDAIDYQQRGWILQYNSSGVERQSFKAGVIPNGFFFY